MDQKPGFSSAILDGERVGHGMNETWTRRYVQMYCVDICGHIPGTVDTNTNASELEISAIFSWVRH